MSGCTVNINTTYNANWYTLENIRFSGYFFDENGNFFEGENAANVFNNCSDFGQFYSLLLKINGVFSVIIDNLESVLVASDKSRFYPVFYTAEYNRFFISDDYFDLAKRKEKCSFNSNQVSFFLNGAFTTGNRTLFKGIYQVQSGEVLEFRNGIRVNSAFKPITLHKTPRASRETIVDLMHLCGKRLAASVKNKQVLLPLSGGYDSRLIACWLKNNSVTDVTCFTFGRKDNPEIEISKNVAGKLGYKWHFVEYNEELIKGFTDTPEFKDYFRHLSRGTSMFFMQEYFAVKELVKRGIVKKGFVAIPGHSGDLLGGSQLYKIIPAKAKIANPARIIQKHIFNKNKLTAEQNEELRKFIGKQLNEFGIAGNESKPDYTIVEEWLIREKLAKYNINSSHAFTFFGGEIRLPFWDDELVNLWLSHTLDKRLFNSEYNNILETEFFEPPGVDFSAKLQPTKSDLLKLKFKNMLMPLVPLSIKNNFNKKNDWVFYDEITQYFQEELQKENIKAYDNGSYYLHRILYWYILQLEKEFIRK